MARDSGIWSLPLTFEAASTEMLPFVPLFVLLGVLGILTHFKGSGKQRSLHGSGQAAREPSRSQLPAAVRPRPPPLASSLQEGEGSRTKESIGGFGGAFSCCMGRCENGPSRKKTPTPTKRNSIPATPPSGSQFWLGTYSIPDIIAAGVPQEHAERIAEIAEILDARGSEPLTDPITLLRFLNAREGVVADAVKMYRTTQAFRETYSMKEIMEIHGSGETYNEDGSRNTDSVLTWKWKRGTPTVEAQLMQRIGFWGRMSRQAPDGAPISILRPGPLDVGGLGREKLVPLMCRGYSAHLEDLLQIGRAESLKQGRMVRARVVVDASGLSLSFLRHISVIKEAMSFGKEYFPEVAASITIIKAPVVFTSIFGAVQAFLTPVQRKKICVLGHNFYPKMKEHAGLDRDDMPRFLGGNNADADMCNCELVPKHALRLLGR